LQPEAVLPADEVSEAIGGTQTFRIPEHRGDCRTEPAGTQAPNRARAGGRLSTAGW
jgi:hypothetical protein